MSKPIELTKTPDKPKNIFLTNTVEESTSKGTFRLTSLSVPVRRLRGETSLSPSFLYRNMCVAHFYLECARKATRSINIDIQELSGMPVIIGDGGNVPLRDFIHCLDENLDIDEMSESLPQLSYAQIDGAIKFLIRLSEFNIHGVDISLEEDKLIESSPEFQAHVRKAMNYNPSDVRTAS